MALLGGGGGREYVLKIIADVTDATKGISEVETKTSSMKDKMVGIGKGVAAGLAGVAVVNFGKDVLNAAADADDANDVMQAAFGETSKSFDKFAKDAATSMGLSETAYKNMAAKTGSLLQSVGINNADAAKSTEVLTQRAADMAAIWGTDVPTAMEAINKGLVGSTKGLTAFGVKISANEIDARAMAKGYVDASGKVTDAGKAIAAQEIIMEKTSNVAGAYAENSGDLGSQQDILKAKFANLQAGLGAGLLPIITKLMEMAQPIIDFIIKNIDILGPLALAIAGVVAAIKIWTAVQWLWNAAMAANPIGLIVLAIAALVAGIVIAYQKVGWFHDLIQTLWEGIQTGFNWIKENWPLLLAILTGPIGVAVLAITKNWDTIKNTFSSMVDRVREIAGTVLEIISAPYRLAYNAIKTVIDKVPGVFTSAVNGVTSALSNIVNTIKKPFEDGWNAASKAGQAVLTWFSNLGTSINNAFSNLANIIKYPFETAFNAIKRLWNATVGGFGFSVPSWVPGVGGKSFKIPMMATGGIVTGPMIAMLGEKAPEAVIPLDRMADMFGGSGESTVININVYALDASAQTGRRIYDSLREYGRVSGNQVVIG